MDARAVVGGETERIKRTALIGIDARGIAVGMEIGERSGQTEPGSGINRGMLAQHIACAGGQIVVPCKIYQRLATPLFSCIDKGKTGVLGDIADEL